MILSTIQSYEHSKYLSILEGGIPDKIVRSEMNQLIDLIDMYDKLTRERSTTVAVGMTDQQKQLIGMMQTIWKRDNNEKQ